jgi:hypothetical protein
VFTYHGPRYNLPLRELFDYMNWSPSVNELVCRVCRGERFLEIAQTLKELTESVLVQRRCVGVKQQTMDTFLKL